MNFLYPRNLQHFDLCRTNKIRSFLKFARRIDIRNNNVLIVYCYMSCTRQSVVEREGLETTKRVQIFK
jgi:hypothetical protein